MATFLEADEALREMERLTLEKWDKEAQERVKNMTNIQTLEDMQSDWQFENWLGEHYTPFELLFDNSSPWIWYDVYLSAMKGQE